MSTVLKNHSIGYHKELKLSRANDERLICMSTTIKTARLYKKFSEGSCSICMFIANEASLIIII